MSNNRKTGAAHSPNEPQRASVYQPGINNAEREADEAVESSFLFMLAWMQQQHAEAADIATMVMYHTVWRLRKKTINILKEAVQS